MRALYKNRKPLFKKNMKACKQRFPKLFERLKRTPLTNRYEVFDYENQAGTLNLIDHDNEKLYYELDDPIGSMAEHMLTTSKKVQGIVAFLGFGLGYGPHMAVKQKNGFERLIVIYEADPEVFLHAFYAFDCSEILNCDDVCLFVGDTPDVTGDTVYWELSGNKVMNAKNLQIVELPASMSLHRTLYMEHVTKLREAVLFRVKSAGNLPSDNLRGIQNIISNLDTLTRNPGIMGLKGLFKGKPGVVVSSGPSLDKNIDLIQSLQGKAVIAAPDASLRMLRKANAFPDFVTSIERMPATARLFEGLEDSDFARSHLVAPGVLHPKTFENFKGSKIVCEREYAIFNWLNFQKGVIPPGPSAGNFAFEFLAYLGCEPIILVGQDLALGENNKTHAKNNFYGDQTKAYQRGLTKTSGNYGKEVTTNEVLNLFRNYYEYQISAYKIRVINATEGGAVIRGTEVKSLSEAIEALDLVNSKVDVSGILEKELIIPTQDEATVALRDIQTKLFDAISFFSATDQRIKAAVEAASTLEEYWNSPESNQDQKLTPSEIESLKACVNDISVITMDDKFRDTAMTYVLSTYCHHMINFIDKLNELEPGPAKDRYVSAQTAIVGLGISSMLKELTQVYARALEQHSIETQGIEIPPNTFRAKTHDPLMVPESTMLH